MARGRFKAVVRGRVQGVGYRFFARQEANDLRISGYVRNLPDGAVEVTAEGEEDALRVFLGLLREGPASASVTGVDVTWETPRGEAEGFFVKA